MGELAGEGAFAYWDPTPPGDQTDTGEFRPFQGPGHFNDFGEFTPRQVGYTTEHGDFQPYEPINRDELGGTHLLSPGSYNSPIYGPGYIDSNHIFHPSLNAGEVPISNQYGPAPDLPTHQSDIQNSPDYPQSSFKYVSLSGVPGIPGLDRNYRDGSLRHSVPGQSEESLWAEQGCMTHIVKESTPEELALIERFNPKIYPKDLSEFLKYIRFDIKVVGLSGDDLIKNLDDLTEALREKRVRDIVDDCAFGLYRRDRDEVGKTVEEAVKKKMTTSEIIDYLFPKIGSVFNIASRYAGYWYDEGFAERNERIKSLYKTYVRLVNPNYNDDIRDAIIDGVASGLKGDKLDSYIKSKAREINTLAINEGYYD